MTDAFRLIGLLFIRSIPTVFFVIIVLVILDRLFFRPLMAVTTSRAGKTVGALEKARQQMNGAEARLLQYESALQAARVEIYRQRQTEHQSALKQHEEAIRVARERAEAMMKDAQAAVEAEVDVAKRQLALSCGVLAGEIAKKILGAADPGGSARA